MIRKIPELRPAMKHETWNSGWDAPCYRAKRMWNGGVVATIGVPCLSSAVT
jgi:hypothetical protein